MPGLSARRFAALTAAFILAGCASHRGAHETPFVPGTPLSSVPAIRGLMRIHATRGGRSDSFRAQLVVAPASRRVELTAYTPLGTSAITLFAEADRVVFLNHIDRTRWEGSAADVAFFGGLEPAAWALAVLGDPMPAGPVVLQRAPSGEVTLVRGSDRVIVTLLETVVTDAVPRAPASPRDYRCCVAPQL